MSMNMESGRMEMKSVTRYRRFKLLKTKEIKYVGDIAPTREERDIYLRKYLNKIVQEEFPNEIIIDVQKEKILPDIVNILKDISIKDLQ